MTRATIETLLDLVRKGFLLTAHLSNPKKKSVDSIVKVTIRQILLKKNAAFQVSSHYSNKVLHSNLEAIECASFIETNLKTLFRQGVFSTKEADFHVLVNKKKEMTVIQKPHIKKNAPLMHNRKKNYLLEEGVAVPFLVALGVMTQEGTVVAKKHDKFRQVNRFLEMVDDVVHHLSKDRTVKIIDFGCGKAYLTFALYHYLTKIKGFAVNIVGLDLKQDVIDLCQALAVRLQYDHLTFEVGDINNHKPAGKVDLMISLHACDTATDAALEKAVSWDAEVILCVPCCQHELYSQVANEPLSSLLRHGILKERFAALVTDAARADLLTMLGYEVQILEFIDLEHTPKNLLIRAVKMPSLQKSHQANKRYLAFSQSLNIRPTLWKKMFADTPSS